MSAYRTVSIALAAVALASCDPQKSNWGLSAITNMKTPPDPPLTCGMAIPPDTLAAQRASCAFGPGSHTSQTLGVGGSLANTFPVRHVIVLMKENRSFDHLLGMLSLRGQPAAEAEPISYVNNDLEGNPVFPFHTATTCIQADPGHQSASVAQCIDNDKMDGFVESAATSTGTDGHFAMAYNDQPDLPFYYWLANTFAVDDLHFAPMDTGTYANRAFFLFGSNAGIVDTGIVYPAPNTPSILQTLINAGFTWGMYTDSQPFSGALDWTTADPGVHSMPDFYAALAAGTLPNVAFVDGLEGVEDDHPLADLQAGEKWVNTIYQAAIASPQWMRMAIVWTYDEAGGFADHVPPEPQQCPASASTASLTKMGPRVPLTVISQWAKRHYVSHVVHDHTAITRLIELLFDLPALTGRDANADALLDLFDFSCSQETTPIPPSPAPGTGGCSDAPAQ